MCKREGARASEIEREREGGKEGGKEREKARERGRASEQEWECVC